MAPRALTDRARRKTRVRNYTDLDSALVREMVAFARPAQVRKFDVEVKNHGRVGYRGRAYVHGTQYHDRWAQPLIVVSVQKLRMGRFTNPRDAHGGYLPMPRMTREEAVLVVLAHELRHLWQREVPKGWRVWGARGQYSERDADAYALRTLRRWRRERVAAPKAVEVDEVEAVDPKEQRREAALVHAQRMLKRAATRLKRATTIARNWKRKVGRLTRAAAAARR